MASNLIVVPLLNDKVDDWKQLVNEIIRAKPDDAVDEIGSYGSKMHRLDI